MELFFDTINIHSQPFQIKKIKRILLRYISKLPANWVGCDPFANNSWVSKLPNVITNDLNPKFNCDYNLEFHDYIDICSDKQFDIVFFDPPYNLSQLKRNYEGIGKDLQHWQTLNQWGNGKNALAKLVKPGGYFISFGYHSKGMGKNRGFQKIELHNFQINGGNDNYNLQVVVEQKIQTTLF